MCTLVIAWQVLEDAPIGVAANRDESLDRPSSPPRIIDGDPRAVAPSDDLAGGTWLGYNERSVLVGLSNRWVDRELEGDRSRGLLVRDLLRTQSADDAAASVESAVVADTYQPFNLVVADFETALVFEWDGGLRVTDLDPGVHVVLNAGWNDRFVEVNGRDDAVARQADSAHRLRDVLTVETGERAETWLERAAAVLADHSFGVCVHGDGFGTRSSSLIALFEDGDASYRFADGPPCRNDYRSVNEQL